MNKKSRRLLTWGILGFISLAVIVARLPWLVTHWTWDELGVSKSNEIGDTIGGIMGPAVGLLAAALTFLAFWAQYDANLEQRRQFIRTIKKQKKADRNQDKRTRLDLFENKFYTMLSIHRDNVNGMDINKIHGRKVFLHLIDELRFLYWVIRDFYTNDPQKASPGIVLNEEEIYQVVYLSFFFGIGEKSTPLVKDLGGAKLLGFVENVHAYILQLIADNNKTRNKLYAVNTSDSVLVWKKVHSLGVGHLRRLSHYIRHLFQTVKFVDDQPSDLLDDKQKYDYITNLRAQLSTYEQLLLYYNSLSVLGEPWLTTMSGNKENYIVKYCMVKSMPINSADFYLSPPEILPQENILGKPMFEWTEIRKRMEKISS
jgi:hypothetical protein